MVADHRLDSFPSPMAMAMASPLFCLSVCLSVVCSFTLQAFYGCVSECGVTSTILFFLSFGYKSSVVVTTPTPTPTTGHLLDLEYRRCGWLVGWIGLD